MVSRKEAHKTQIQKRLFFELFADFCGKSFFAIFVCSVDMFLVPCLPACVGFNVPGLMQD